VVVCAHVTSHCGRHSRLSSLHRYNPQRAQHSPHSGVAGVRRLCHHPIVLASYSSPHGLLAFAAIAIQAPDSALDSDVGNCRCDYWSVAKFDPLHNSLGLATSCAALRLGNMDIQALRRRVQRRAAWRPSRNSPRSSRTASGDSGHTCPGPAPGLSRPFMRDAGLERGNGTCRLLRTNRLRAADGRSHDPIGRPGTREAVRRRIPQLQATSACRIAQNQAGRSVKFSKRNYHELSKMRCPLD
jgi:hypothetical protein